MGQAKQGDTVKVHYTGRVNDSVFDSSRDGDPLEFTIGDAEIIPGFEEAVKGMEPGDTKTVDVDPDDAYGPHQDELVLTIDRGELPDEAEPETGQFLELRQQDGSVVPAKITSVTLSEVTVDANHPLAGKELSFDIELVDIE